MDRTGVATETPKSPWGSATPAAPACSLADVMSEQLATQLDEENNTVPALSEPGADVTLSDEAHDTTSDLMLAQMLQMQFDREFDDQLRREEKKFNGDSKVSISFENYRKVHPYEDSDSSEDEVDWQDTRDDPYKAGFIGKGKNITTKHDEVTCGRKNAARMDNEQAVDPRTRLLMYKMVNAGVLENINGCISTGKEAVVFHADGGSLEEQPVPDEVVLKVFKTTLNEFKNRDRYIKDDYRFRDRFSKLNPRKVIRLWAEKEMHNLARMKKAEIPCPEVVLLKKHILVMSFIGKDHVPAPKLKDAMLGSEEMKNAYYQVLHMMQQLYQECNLVHADLSEYNMLWHEGKVWFIDVSQSIEPTHPHGLEFLFRDCRNVSTEPRRHVRFCCARLTGSCSGAERHLNGSGAERGDTMSGEHYLELCENPVQFENASSVNNVFFDEANKQVFAVRSGGATGVVVKGPDDKSSVAFRMDDKGEVKCIKFSIGNKILAVQRTSKSVDFINFIPDYPHTEFTQECKDFINFIPDYPHTEFTQEYEERQRVGFLLDQLERDRLHHRPGDRVLPDKRSAKLLKSQSINVNWYQYCPETSVILLSTTVQGNVLQPFAFRNGTMSKMSKFEIELPVVPKPAKLSLSERDIAMATM
ncbi:hypothetical protein F2P81_019686 [Scophthalmus maximus]|uniref:Serine/threonine-protein kinase RIO3 n=1 Tax=Scophthalmus maximus TaxID=52904 RepID=A0A6A4S7T2_SCOMX|nr:hypothetical protein F2P81_019686 [Scophthalmus maximus]